MHSPANLAFPDSKNCLGIFCKKSRRTLFPPIRRTRNHHSLAFQIPMAGTDIYKSSFFPQTIRDWNLVTDSLITASECAVDSVTKFTSLVRARD